MATIFGTSANDTVTASESLVNSNSTWNGGGGIDTFVITDSNVSNLFRYFTQYNSGQTNPFTGTVIPLGTNIFLSATGTASGFTLTNYEKLQYRNASNVIVTTDLSTYIVGFSPTDTATNVAVDSNIVLTFNENVAKGTSGNITITDAAGVTVETFSAAASSLLTFSGKTLTINPTNNLASNTHYFVNLDANTVTSTVAGHGFVGTSSTGATTGYDFTTGLDPIFLNAVSVATFLTTPTQDSVIVDTAANIGATINDLHTQVANIANIVTSDSQTGSLIAINATQLNTGADVLAKISNAYAISITDSSANIATNIDALGANVLKIVAIFQTGTPTPLEITGTQFANNSAVFLKFANTYNLTVSDVLAANTGNVLSNQNVTSITISDSSANIAASLDSLQTYFIANPTKLISITQSGVVTPLALTATQVINDSAVLSKIVGTYSIAYINEAPIFTSFSPTIATENENTQLTINFDNLLTHSNANDVDGTVTAFNIKSVTSGSLLIGTDLANATPWDAITNFTINSSSQAFWTPDLNSASTINAFTAVAVDNTGLESSTSVQAKINVTPTLSHNINELVTFWKTGAVISGITSTLISDQPVTTPQIEFKNIQINADGSRTFEIWENSTGVNNLDIHLSLPSKSIATWIDDINLPQGWSSLINTQSTGQFDMAGIGLNALATGSIKLGTLNVSNPTQSNSLNVQLTSGLLDNTDVSPFNLYTDNSSNLTGTYYAHTNILDGNYTLGTTKSALSIGNAIRSNDALEALKIAVDINPNQDGSAISAYQYLAADINHDGRVNATDALNILQMSANLNTAPSKTWLFVPDTVGNETMTRTSVNWVDTNLPVTGNQDQTINIVGVVAGDVNGTWIG